MHSEHERVLWISGASIVYSLDVCGKRIVHETQLLLRQQALVIKVGWVDDTASLRLRSVFSCVRELITFENCVFLLHNRERADFAIEWLEK